MRRTIAYRRHQTQRHMWRRLKEDRNQHYDRQVCLLHPERDGQVQGAA